MLFLYFYIFYHDNPLLFIYHIYNSPYRYDYIETCVKSLLRKMFKSYQNFFIVLLAMATPM